MKIATMTSMKDIVFMTCFDAIENHFQIALAVRLLKKYIFITNNLSNRQSYVRHRATTICFELPSLNLRDRTPIQDEELLHSRKHLAAFNNNTIGAINIILIGNNVIVDGITSTIFSDPFISFMYLISLIAVKLMPGGR